MGNEVRGLLNPLLVRLSARPPVRLVCASSALIRPSARPPVRPSPVCPSASPLPHVCLSARPPPVRPPATVRPSAPRPPVRPSASVRPSAPRPPRPRYPKITYRSLLVLNFLPLLRHVRSPCLQFVAPAGAAVASG